MELAIPDVLMVGLIFFTGSVMASVTLVVGSLLSASHNQPAQPVLDDDDDDWGDWIIFNVDLTKHDQRHGIYIRQ